MIRDFVFAWGRYVRANLSAYLLAAIVLTVWVFVLFEIGSRTGTWWEDRKPSTAWFEYHGVRFVEEDPTGRGGLGSLRMESDTTIRADGLSLSFRDTLRCQHEDTTVLEFVSQNPDTAAFVVDARPRRQGTWLYNADYPYGRVCVVQSTITAERDSITKVQIVTTPRVCGEGRLRCGP